MRIKGLPIVRSGMLYRADGEGDLGTLEVRFSPFDTWYEINSWWEGRFLERTTAGAFTKTAREAKRSDGTFSTKMLFNHGTDFNIGDKPLAVPNRFEEIRESDYNGPILSGPMLDTSYTRDLEPGLRANAFGSSFMFEVVREEWNNEPDTSDHNPEGLPERTVREVRTFEAGPVTWPASPTATAGMRSLSGTDGWMEKVNARSATRHQTLVDSYAAFRAMYKTPDFRASTSTPSVDDPERRQVDEAATERAVRLRNYRLELMKRGY